MRTLQQITSLIVVLFLSLSAGAQDDEAPEIQEIRRYTVEMIIFKYAQDVGTGNEIFAGDEPDPDDALLDAGTLTDSQRPARSRPRSARDVEFALLPRDDYTMGDIMSRLRRLDAYSPVMHFGWTQVTLPEEETQAIRLSSMGRLPAGMDGSLTLYLSRFLHLVVDLQLDAPNTANDNGARGGSVSSYGDYGTSNEFGDIGRRGPVLYRINENRILRSGELRYFDHPKFGVLAKVSRVEESAEDTNLTNDTELLGYPAD